MTATTLDSNTSGGLRFAVQDALVLAGRSLRHTTRQPELLIFSTIQPVLFVFLFRYVFGGAVDTGPIPYVQYLMAGIFVQTTAFGSTSTGVGLAEDLSKGIVDRFRSMPISRSAVLAGRTLGDLVRIVGVVLIMAAVGMLVGIAARVVLGVHRGDRPDRALRLRLLVDLGLDRPDGEGRRDRQRRRLRLAVPADLRVVGLRAARTRCPAGSRRSPRPPP